MIRFLKPRDRDLVGKFVFTDEFLVLIGLLGEYKDEDDDALVKGFIKACEGYRFDQVLRALSFFMWLVMCKADFQVPGFEKLLSDLDKKLRKK